MILYNGASMFSQVPDRVDSMSLIILSSLSPCPPLSQTNRNHLCTSPPFFSQSIQLPGYSPTLFHPASLASPAAARLRTPALQ